TFIYAADGKQLAALDAGQNRVPVQLSAVPVVVRDAVLSSEDRNFYHHGGIDPLGVARALVNDLRGKGNLQGGSTITQQYVKQAYLSSQRTLVRKIKEAALAVRLQRRLTKNQILERYLNTIYWGRGAYGIQAASQTYFGVNASDLTLPQAALLAGMIRGPELADPTRNPATATVRRADTLRAMVRDHHITQRDADQAGTAPLGALPPDKARFKVFDSANGTDYFISYVRYLLEQRYDLGIGLRVTTTLDLGMQDKAYKAIYDAKTGGLQPYRTKYPEPAGALVAVDDTGQVRAMVGGQDYQKSQVNLAVGASGGGSGRQPGSTFKPFLLAETVKDGYSVKSSFPAPPTILIKGKGEKGLDYQVNNFSMEDGGPSASLIDATAQSLNTVYAQLEQAIGADRLVQMALDLGLSPSDVGLSPNASLVLGTPQVSVLEMAAAYSTFARGGTYISPQVITKVTAADGTPLPWAAPATKSVLTRQQNAQVVYCLQQVVLKGTGTGAYFGAPIAGKTGTTTNSTDAWFIGFTPKLTAAVWMGYPNGDQPMTDLRGLKGGLQGGQIPASLWQRFMSSVVGNGNYTGTFDTVNSFPGSLIGPPPGISYPQGTGTTATTLPKSSSGSSGTSGTSGTSVTPTTQGGHPGNTIPTTPSVPPPTLPTTATTKPTTATTKKP
ncbi:MAG: transglycosylase domain-containing protein, partial [Actinomycetota bacterium]|nr:transglycosylase domain-containing protein [Actinomycetota bacterium]